MLSVYRKISRALVLGILFSFILASAASADPSIVLKFNDQEWPAEVIVKDGRSFLTAESLQKIPGVSIDSFGQVPLRQFFESQDGTVDWDQTKKQVIVSWRAEKDGLQADDLVLKSSEALKTFNTYHLSGKALTKMTITPRTAETVEIPDIPEITAIIEGAFQQEPLALYVKHRVELPADLAGNELSQEEAALFPQGEMMTEMLWTDQGIYQKTPLHEQWVSQDLAGMDMMGNLTNLMQMSPQQSLEMMRQFGIIYVFGDDVVIDGQEYYTVKNYVDSKTFKKILEEYMNNLDMAGLMGTTQLSTEQNEAEKAAVVQEMQKVLEQMMTSMELDYYIDSLINKKTLITEEMFFNMQMKYSMDEAVNPDGAMDVSMKMQGDFQLFDFGQKIKLPDVSEAISQEEYLEIIMDQMAAPESTPDK